MVRVDIIIAKLRNVESLERAKNLVSYILAVVKVTSV